MVMKLPRLRNLRHSDLFVVFNWKDDRGKGRCCMLASAILSTLVTDLTAGTLYTAFLTVNNFSIVDAGVLTFLPLIASCFSIFSPMILERFKKRRWILAGGRLAYYVINILGLTLLPYLVQEQSEKMFCIGAVVFTASLVNNLFTSGYSVWHLNFIPDSVRARYLSYQQMITALLSGAALIGSGLLADALRGSPNEAAVLTVLRVVGFCLAAADVTFLALPREYEYPHRESRIRLLNVFRLPFGNRKFVLTMGLIAFWTFLSNLPASSWTYYLLNTAHTGVTMINTLSFVYGFFLVLLTPWWQRVLKKQSWFKTFAIAAFMNVPTVFAAAFIAEGNRVWLYPLVRLCQHALGVGLNLTWANFPYINTPREDQTYYMSFYFLMANLVAFFGQFTGTLFVKWMNGQTAQLFGAPLSAVQILVLAQGVLNLICAVLVLRFLPQLTPAPGEEPSSAE